LHRKERTPPHQTPLKFRHIPNKTNPFKVLHAQTSPPQRLKNSEVQMPKDPVSILYTKSWMRETAKYRKACVNTFAISTTSVHSRSRRTSCFYRTLSTPKWTGERLRLVSRFFHAFSSFYWPFGSSDNRNGSSTTWLGFWTKPFSCHHRYAVDSDVIWDDLSLTVWEGRRIICQTSSSSCFWYQIPVHYIASSVRWVTWHVSSFSYCRNSLDSSLCDHKWHLNHWGLFWSSLTFAVVSTGSGSSGLDYPITVEIKHSTSTSVP